MINTKVRLYLPLDKKYLNIPDENKNLEDIAKVTQKKFIGQGMLTWLVYTEGD